MSLVAFIPRNLLAFLATGALIVGAPTMAHAHGGTDRDGPAAAAAPGSPEAKLREFETQAIGAEHAAAHARQRETAQEAQSEGSASSVRPRAAPLPAVPTHIGGKWDDARTIPVIAINAVMLPTGKVLMFAYPARPGYPGYANKANAFVWDPVSGSSTQIDPPDDPDTGEPTNIWCGGASFLPDGRVLITGGNVGDPRTDFYGLDTVFTFNPFTEQWDPPATNASMAQGRWYPSQMLMPDGRSLIAGGLTRPGDADFDDPGGDKANNDLELISPNGTIERQPGFFNGVGDPPLSGLYPRMFWMPSGRALSVGPFATDTWFATPSSPGAPTTSSDVPNLSTDREWGTAIVSEDKVLTLGGSRPPAADPNPPEGESPANGKRPAQRTTEYFDESNPEDGWQAAAPMEVARSHANSVLLPDGKVATVGGGYGEDPGQQFYRWLLSDSQREKRAELFDPTTNTTVLGNAQAEARTYHSTGLLLPDGRVMSAGDDINGADGPGTPSGTSSDTAEIYSPPYLFKPDGTPASRPVITQAPSSIAMGAGFEIAASGATATKAVLVAPGASTHATDMSQRLVAINAPVAVPGSPGRLALTLPADPDLAPPGYYMLFLLSADGVPSVSKFVRVEAAPDATPPVVTLTAPAAGSSTYDTTPTYTGAAGNLSGDRAASTVRIYAGPTASGTPVQKRTASRSGASWTVDGSPALAAGTYTALAEQSDYAGNTGLSSSRTFTILAPPKPSPPPPPVPPPPPPVKPTLTISGTLPSLRTVRRTKRFVLTVTVSEPGRVKFDGLLDRGKKPAKRLVQRPTVTFKSAGKRRLTFKLTRAGLRLLADKRRGVVWIRAQSFFSSGRKLPVVRVRRTLR